MGAQDLSAFDDGPNPGDDGSYHDDGEEYGDQQLGDPASGPAQIEVVDAELAEEESVHGGGDLRLVGHARTVHVLRLSLPGLDGGLAAHRGVGVLRIVGGIGCCLWLPAGFLCWLILILRLILIVHGCFPSLCFG